MCRLYGFRATDPTRVDCSLVRAQNALLVQSATDLRGVANGDGWGLAHWSDGSPSVQKRARAAHEDLLFNQSVATTRSKTFVAHVRAATVGDPSEDNTHPFVHGPWVFAHNGTITAFDDVAPLLDPGPFGPPLGATDSEHAFRWLLNRMAEFGLDPARPAEVVEPIVDLISAGVLDIVSASKRVGAQRPPKLNFLMSDGEHLVASRWGNSLYWTERRGIRDCNVCGLLHCPEAAGDYQATVIASEPITDEPWTEVQEGSIVAIDEEARLTTWDLMTRAA